MNLLRSPTELSPFELAFCRWGSAIAAIWGNLVFLYVIFFSQRLEAGFVAYGAGFIGVLCYAHFSSEI
jgi:hypothetical protein